MHIDRNYDQNDHDDEKLFSNIIQFPTFLFSYFNQFFYFFIKLLENRIFKKIE